MLGPFCPSKSSFSIVFCLSLDFVAIRNLSWREGVVGVSCKCTEWDVCVSSGRDTPSLTSFGFTFCNYSFVILLSTVEGYLLLVTRPRKPWFDFVLSYFLSLRSHMHLPCVTGLVSLLSMELPSILRVRWDGCPQTSARGWLSGPKFTFGQIKVVEDCQGIECTVHWWLNPQQTNYGQKRETRYSSPSPVRKER